VARISKHILVFAIVYYLSKLYSLFTCTYIVYSFADYLIVIVYC